MESSDWNSTLFNNSFDTIQNKKPNLGYVLCFQMSLWKLFNASFDLLRVSLTCENLAKSRPPGLYSPMGLALARNLCWDQDAHNFQSPKNCAEAVQMLKIAKCNRWFKPDALKQLEYSGTETEDDFVKSMRLLLLMKCGHRQQTKGGTLLEAFLGFFKI